MLTEDYVPYSEEWVKNISKLPKKIIVGMFARVGQSKDLQKYEGVLLGLKICKEMFAQNQISHENIYENEIYFKELILKEKAKIEKLSI